MHSEENAPSTPGKLRTWFLITLGMLSLSAGAVRANLIPLFLRFVIETKEETNETWLISYTHLAYLCINLGGLAANGISYFFLLQKDYRLTGFFLTVVISAMALFLALCILSLQYCAFQKYERSSHQVNYCLFGCQTFTCCCNKNVRPVEDLSTSMEVEVRKTEDQRDFKDMMRVSLSLLLFKIASSQIISSFVDQSAHLDIYKDARFSLNVGSIVFCNKTSSLSSNQYKVPPSFANIFNSFPVVLLIPIIWFLARRPSLSRTARKRVWLANFFVLVSLSSAFFVELTRKYYADLSFSFVCTKYSSKFYLQVIPCSNLAAVPWQMPQMVLLGIGEAVGGPASMEYFVSFAKERYWSLAFGIFNFIEGFGSILGLSLILVVNKLGVYFKSWSKESSDTELASIVIPHYEKSDINSYLLFLIIILLIAIRMILPILLSFSQGRKRGR